MSGGEKAGSQRILVIRGGALGDFVLTLPVLAALRRTFPRHRREILGYPSIAALAVAAGLADDVSAVESPRLAGLFVLDGICSPDIGVWLASFDLIISYIHDPDGVFRANVAKLSTARFIAGPHRPDEVQAIHASEALIKPLEALGIRDADSCPRMPLSGNVPVRPTIAIHPGSGSERKNWPEAYWAELLKWFANEYTADFLLIGGEAEGDRCARLASVLPEGRAEIARNLPLVDLAKRMKSCAAFIGHDSGITHLASALDLPGLVLWGETNLAVWKPKFARMRIVRHPAGLAALSVAEVGKAFQLFGWRFRAANSKLG
jgi:ADP-heptose:LPS heptosyltransferase